MRKFPIFEQAGGISIQSLKTNNSAFLTITPVVTSRRYGDDDSVSWDPSSVFGSEVIALGNDKTALYAHMPITGVNISQGVDMSIAKTLNADFLVSEFGDVPVQITLSGVNFYGFIGCNKRGITQHQQIMDFYEKNKLSANSGNRIDISITPAVSPNSGAFRCVLCKLRISTPIKDGQGMLPAYTYEMSLIGVRR